MRQFRSKAKPARERGVALLLTLGILALLTVLAFTFAVAAINSKYVSQLNEQLIRARMEAESGLQLAYRTIATVYYDGTDLRNLFPATRTDIATEYLTRFGPTITTPAAAIPWEGRVYLTSTSTDQLDLKKYLHVVLGDLDFTPDTTADLPGTTAGWLDIKDVTGDTIVSRILWLAIDESGKIDPNESIDSRAGGAEGNESDTRIGASTTEINLKNLFDSDAIATQFMFASAGGSLPDSILWFSHFQIFRQNSAVAGNSTAAREVGKHVFPFSYDIEAYYSDGYDHHRYDLANANWDGFANTLASSGLEADASYFWTEVGQTQAASIGGIPWLYYGSDTDVRRQVIANLIDYCDSDNVATCDDADSPTYAGTELTPMLNEFNLLARMENVGTASCALTVTVTPEVVNIFPPEQILGNGGRMTLTLTLESTETGTRSLDLVWPSQPAMPGHSYMVLSSIPGSIALDSTYVSLSNFRVRIDKAKFMNATGGLWDFARTEFSPVTSLSGASAAMISTETNDPRCNLLASQWTWEVAGWQPMSLGTLGYKNSVCLPNPGGDTDPEPGAVEPWDVSTAYVRNGPMQSLWELGALHRGKPWQTLRLSRYDVAALKNTGLGDYALGDANILDQVKVDSRTEAKGRININTYNANVLRALFAGVRIGCTYASPSAGGLVTISKDQGTEIGGTPGAPLSGQVLYRNGATGYSTASADLRMPFRNRGQLASCANVTTGLASLLGLAPEKNNDRLQEELLGKTANLLTTRQNFFTVIVVAQVIKDLPTGVKNGTLGVYDAGIDRVLGQQRVMAVLYRDAFTNNFRLIRYEYLED